MLAPRETYEAPAGAMPDTIARTQVYDTSAVGALSTRSPAISRPLASYHARKGVTRSPVVALARPNAPDRTLPGATRIAVRLVCTVAVPAALAVTSSEPMPSGHTFVPSPWVLVPVQLPVPRTSAAVSPSSRLPMAPV